MCLDFLGQEENLEKAPLKCERTLLSCVDGLVRIKETVFTLLLISKYGSGHEGVAEKQWIMD